MSKSTKKTAVKPTKMVPAYFKFQAVAHAGDYISVRFANGDHRKVPLESLYPKTNIIGRSPLIHRNFLRIALNAHYKDLSGHEVRKITDPLNVPIKSKNVSLNGQALFELVKKKIAPMTMLGFIEKTGVSNYHIYRMGNSDWNPGVKTLIKIMSAADISWSELEGLRQ